MRVFDLNHCSNDPEVEMAGHRSAIKCAVWCTDDCIISCAEDEDLW